MKVAKSVSHCIVCAYVREDKSRSLANGLFPVMLTTIQYLHQHHVHFVHCEIPDVKHSNITQRCNKYTKSSKYKTEHSY